MSASVASLGGEGGIIALRNEYANINIIILIIFILIF